MGWRDEREKVLRSKPVSPAPTAATANRDGTKTETRQNELKVESGVFNSAHWVKEIECLVERMSRNDPRGGCWGWAEKNLAEKWRELMRVLHEIDATFEEQRAVEIRKGLTFVDVLYHEIIDAWRKCR